MSEVGGKAGSLRSSSSISSAARFLLTWLDHKVSLAKGTKNKINLSVNTFSNNLRISVSSAMITLKIIGRLKCH